MIIRNNTSLPLFLGWVTPLGKQLSPFGELGYIEEIDDSYSTNQNLRALRDSGDITITSFSSDDLDYVVQKELNDAIAGVEAGVNAIINEQVIAAVPLDAYTVVAIGPPNYIKKADNSSSGTAPAFGITIEDIEISGLGKVVLEGVVENPLWSLTPEQTIFLGTNGSLTQTRPTTGYVQVLGEAISSNRIFFSSNMQFTKLN